MRLLNVSLLSLLLALPVGFANADNMGRLNGYAKAPSGERKVIHLSDTVVVDSENKRVSNHGRLSGYAKSSSNASTKLEKMPVLAGMRDIGPVKNTEGFGRLNGYGDNDEPESEGSFQILDTTNIAIWY